tara:strand:- start:873 stop:8822 length:7950 start_codon:yes stop_codon:yes gene_type:complete
MNKDLDERLVPKNEYIDALNIDIATSNSGDVGSAQNSYGNTVKTNSGIAGAKCIGSVLYPNNSLNSTSIIYFIAGDNTNAIVEYFPEQQILVPILIDVFSVTVQLNGDMVGARDDSFVINSNSGSNLRFGMQALLETNQPKIVDLNKSTTHAHGPIAGNTTQIITMSSPNADIIVGQTVTGAGITNNVTVGSVNGNQIVLSGAPGGTIPSNVQLTFTSVDTVTIDTYESFVDDQEIVFSDEGFLKFDKNKKLTAINVLDGLLLWTDGVNEPKKINIEQMKTGCSRLSSSFFTQTTKLFVNNVKVADKVTEKDITVIKKYPLNGPALQMSSSVREGKTSSYVLTPTNTAFSGGGGIHARGSGDLRIKNQEFKRPLAYRADIGQNVLRFDASVSGVANVMADGIHYKHWRSVTQGMSVEVNGSTISAGVEAVNYENHTVRLTENLTSAIEYGDIITFRRWLAPYNNNSFWTYETTDNQIQPKPIGVSNEEQTGVVDKNGYPIRIEELVFNGQPNYFKGDTVVLQTTNPTASSDDDPKIKVKVKLLDEVIDSTQIIEPGNHADGISNEQSELLSANNQLTNSNSNNWHAYGADKSTNGLIKYVQGSVAEQFDDANVEVAFLGTQTFEQDTTYKIVVGYEAPAAGEVLRGAIRVKLTDTVFDDYPLETTAITDDDSTNDTLSIKNLNPNIVAGMRVTSTNIPKADNRTVSSVSGTSVVISGGGAATGNNETLYFSPASAGTATFYLHTKKESKEDMSFTSDFYGLLFNGATIGKITSTAGVQPGMIMTWYSTSSNETVGGVVKEVTSATEVKLFSAPLANPESGATITFKSALAIQAVKGLTNDDDVNFNITSVSVKKLNLTIGDGLAKYGFSGTNSRPGYSRRVFNAKILTISDSVVLLDTSQETTWEASLLKKDALFEDKFIRFAYRWQYHDGEYSAISPFSKIAFLPDIDNGYQYDSEDGYNLAMQNNVRSLVLSEFDAMPDNVVGFELLYKESNSSNIYSFLKKSSGDLENLTTISIDSETNQGALPSNQILRPYDNVPKSAKAQEISANRLIYANYKQQYDITGDLNDNAKLNYVFKNVSNQVNDSIPKESMKSFRNYDLGVCYLDKYGRQTPVFTRNDKQIQLGNTNAKTANVFEAQVTSEPEDWATHYKYFVHDKYNDHYNIALDRFYEAGEYVWLSFVSADANKVQENDFIILKKNHDSDSAIQSDTKVKYKVLEKTNEAPESIKGVKESLGKALTTLFGTSSAPSVGFPSIGAVSFRVRGSSMVGTELEGVHDLDQTNKYVRIGNSTEVIYSDYYAVASVLAVDHNDNGDFADNDDYYEIVLQRPLEGDVNFIGTPTSQNANNFIEFYENNTLEYKKEFEGKFFVKILKDEYITDSILALQSSTDEAYYNLKYSQKFFWGLTYNDGIPTGGTNYHSTGNNVLSETFLDTNTWLQDTYSWSQIFNGGRYSVSNPTGSQGGPSFTGNFPESTYGPGGFFIAEQQWTQGTNPINTTHVDADLKGVVDGTTYKSGQKWLIDQAFSWSRAGVFNMGQDYGVGNGAQQGRGFVPGNDFCNFRLHSIPYMSTEGSEITQIPTGGTVPNSMVSENYQLYKDLQKPGTMFRWKDDPDLTVYTIVESSSHGVHSYQHSQVQDLPFDDDGDTIAITAPVGQDITNGDTEIETFTKNLGTGAMYGLYDTYYHVDVGTVLKRASDNVVIGTIVSKYTLTNAGLLHHRVVLQSAVGSGQLVSQNDDIKYFHIASNGITDNFNEVNPADPEYSGRKNEGWRFDLKLDKVITWSPTSLLNADGTSNSNNILHLTSSNNRHADSNSSVIQILNFDTGSGTGESFYSKNPAVFEVEPPPSIDTNLYYETTKSDLIIKPGMHVSVEPYLNQAGSLVSNALAQDAIIDRVAYDVEGNFVRIGIDGTNDTIVGGAKLTIYTKDENGKVEFTQDFYVLSGNIGFQNDQVGNRKRLDHHPRNTDGHGLTIRPCKLKYFNCYSFGNGVESNRIRDDFNALTIDKGPRVSTTLLSRYKEEDKKHGFIFSGIYNNVSGVNNLNQFIQAENITKELNPVYGSIQKLFTRNTNLLAFCEDKVLKVLSNKDALFNADGSPDVVSTNRVLGEAIPFVGEYGISKNPESFSNYGFRVYFSDKERGAVLRLSGDGITDISEKGMKNFFKENLQQASSVVGTYDQNKNLYNLTLNSKTISFSEDVNGWTSLKSFLPEGGISFENNYFTFFNGELWKHSSNSLKNNFYGTQYESTIKFIFNDEPSIIKSFKNLSYEGSKSKSYNTDGVEITTKENGWYSDSLQTDLQSGEVKFFKEKEGKWFNYIKGVSLTDANIDAKEFSVQGLGVCSAVAVSSGSHDTKYPHVIKLVKSNDSIAFSLVGGTYGFIGGDFAVSSSSGEVNPATLGTTHTAAGFTVNSTSQITGTARNNGDDSITSGARFLRNVITTLIPGQTYTISATISGYSSSFSTGENSIGFANTSGIGEDAKRTSNGLISKTFVATGTNVSIFKGAYVAGVISNISITREEFALYPKYIITDSVTNNTTSLQQITTNRAQGTLNAETKHFYLHSQSVDGQKWGVSTGTLTEVSDPSSIIGTLVSANGYNNGGSWTASNSYVNTSDNIVRVSINVGTGNPTLPGTWYGETSVVKINMTPTLVQS